MTMALESDEEFLRYMYYHSTTERHLFSRKHVTRLFTMAGLKEGKDFSHLSDFEAVNAEVVQPLVEKIRGSRQGEAKSPVLDPSPPAPEPEASMNVVARLNLKGPQIDFHMYLPVVSGRFHPANFSYPWPLVHGKWDAHEYTAQMDYDEEANIVVMRWSDDARTTFELKKGLMLKKGMQIGLNQQQPAKYFLLTVADLSWL